MTDFGRDVPRLAKRLCTPLMQDMLFRREVQTVNSFNFAESSFNLIYKDGRVAHRDVYKPQASSVNWDRLFESRLTFKGKVAHVFPMRHCTPSSSYSPL